MCSVSTEFLFNMTVNMGQPVVLGTTPAGQVTFQHATGGRIEGPRLKGEVVPVGGDRAVVRADGTCEIQVQVLIRTDDAQIVYMNYRGLIVAPPQVWAQFAAREKVDPASYYWRIAPMFETGAAEYQWLNRVVGVGLGQLESGKVIYDVHALR
jgi:Protein of unknown function (DUF3237)